MLVANVRTGGAEECSSSEHFVIEIAIEKRNVCVCGKEAVGWKQFITHKVVEMLLNSIKTQFRTGDFQPKYGKYDFLISQ